MSDTEKNILLALIEQLKQLNENIAEHNEIRRQEALEYYGEISVGLDS